jgi:hypothetical protein
VEGDRLEDLRVKIEGSPALLELVRARSKPEDLEGMQMEPTGTSQPKIFLSYGSKDRDLANSIALGTMSAGRIYNDLESFGLDTTRGLTGKTECVRIFYTRSESCAKSLQNRYFNCWHG